MAHQALADYASPFWSVDVGLFASKFIPEELTQAARQTLASQGFPEGDWRDPAAVQAWGRRVMELLRQESIARGI